MSENDDNKPGESKLELDKESTELLRTEDTRTVFEKNLEEPIKNNYTKYGLRFTGTYYAYYKLWLVNTVLSIISFGIYSAWAKVRKKKYLYQHTSLTGETFDFHADPKKILKGRVLVLAAYLIFLFLGKYYPQYSPLLVIAFTFLYPWLIVRAMIFRMNNTSYRNIRFGFKKEYRESYAVFFKTTIVSVISLGLGAIWGVNKNISFLANNIRYGKKTFTYFGSSKPIYKSIFSSAIIVALLATGGVFIISPYVTEGNSPILIATMIVGSYLLFFLLMAVFNTAIFNNTLNFLKLDGIAFRGQASTAKYLGLMTGNLFILLFSFGLAYPITTIRNHKFKVNNARIRVPNTKGLDGFVGESRPVAGTLAEAVDDFWDIEIGI